MRNFFSSDQEKLLKFEAEGREFAKKFLTVGQNNFGNKMPCVVSIFLSIFTTYLNHKDFDPNVELKQFP